MSSDDSDESGEGESNKLGSKSGSSGTLWTGLGGLLCGGGFTLGVTLSADESCDGDGGSLAIPYKKLVKWVLDEVYVHNVPAMSISFLLHKY